MGMRTLCLIMWENSKTITAKSQRIIYSAMRFQAIVHTKCSESILYTNITQLSVKIYQPIISKNLSVNLSANYQ